MPVFLFVLFLQILVDKLYYTTYNIAKKIILHICIVSEISKGVKRMVFNTGAALLDAIVLAVVSREQEGTYGYKITQDVRKVLEVSESTLYPVLRRLQKDECLEVYDRQFDGRNRRYYKVTPKGTAQLNLYHEEWKLYSRKIQELFEGGAAI